MYILYSLNYTVLVCENAFARQVIWRESSKALDSAVGTIFDLGGGGGKDKILRSFRFDYNYKML